MLGGSLWWRVALAGLAWGPGLVRSEPQPVAGLGLPPAPAAPCASGPGAGAYVGAPNTHPRSTPIFPGRPRSQAANTPRHQALALPPPPHPPPLLLLPVSSDRSPRLVLR